MIKDRVLVIDDERAFRILISTSLSAQGYEVKAAATGKEAETMITSQSPDVIILDLGLPDMDGMDILKKLRAWSKTPVIIVSARTSEEDKVMALEAGADDYVEKPFSTGELAARVRTALRHTRMNPKNHQLSQFGKFIAGSLVVDYNEHSVQVNGIDAHLTPLEYKIVSLLARHAGRLLTYDYITREIWGPYVKRNVKSLRVHMVNIRKKLERNPADPEYIFTELSEGYRMREPEE